MLSSGDFFRKIIHLGNAVIPLSYLIAFTERWFPVLILSILLGLAVGIEFMRIRSGWVKRFFRRHLDFMLKTDEMNGTWTGATWVFTGSLVTIMVFPKAVAVLALLFMCFGDTVAALTGKAWGKVRIGKKSLEGFASGLAICFLLAWFFPELSWPVRSIGAVMAMSVELLPIPIDDNLRIPVFSGAAMVLAGAVGL
ncbi:MAG: diacylglycerol/polyprenol kinase family protein [Fidelibacterota bacterium]